MKDSLWSADLFRCESEVLRTHWILVVMDQYTRRIIGFGLHRGTVDGLAKVGFADLASHLAHDIPVRVNEGCSRYAGAQLESLQVVDS